MLEFVQIMLVSWPQTPVRDISMETVWKWRQAYGSSIQIVSNSSLETDLTKGAPIMIVSNITDPSVITRAANTVGVRIDNYRTVNAKGTRVAFVLRLTSGLPHVWQRLSHSGRRVAAVCWHGHEAFFRELFKLDPSIEIRTHWAGGDIHYTADNFEQTFGETGYANVGSVYEPCAYRDACDPESHRTL